MSVVDDYLADLGEPRRAPLDHIRHIVREAVPDAVEEKSYGVPAFKVDGRPLLGFSAGRQHLSLYPFSPAVIDALQHDLAGHELAKGTIRFSEENPISDELVRSIVARRLGEIRTA
jgi:uncharacterized protein YdhG (YjbR/CyaY superfamily)